MLDNFEQVIEAASIVKLILTTAPNVKILVTSRVPLRITGEREYILPLLSSPGRDQQYPFEEWTTYESIRLFVERAVEIKPDFKLSTENAAVMTEICSRLEGLPLGIELAAANIRILTLQGILSQLDNRLRFLKSNARDLTPRQRTLRGTIDWSYELLTPDEQTLFRRLAVLVGPADLEAIEGICNDGELNVFEIVESLVEKSMLKITETYDEIRYSMLETLKEYAWEKLQTKAETASLQGARHVGRMPEERLFDGQRKIITLRLCYKLLGPCFGSGKGGDILAKGLPICMMR